MSTNQRKQHVFLFRHCVRSVRVDIPFYEEDGNETKKVEGERTSSSSTTRLYSTNPLDYLSQWPAWNTPPEWCTEEGTHRIRGTGVFVLKEFILNDNNDNDDGGSSSSNADDENPNNDDGNNNKKKKKKSILFVSDKSPRDVQSALAMMTGMAETVVLPKARQQQQPSKNPSSSSSYEIQGLDTMEIDPPLFHPFESNGYRSQTIQQEQVCTKPPKEEIQKAIQERLQRIPPPTNLSNIMDWIKMRTGIHDVFHVFETNDPNHGRITISKDGQHFQGAFNLVKYIAQSVFYSQASGIADGGSGGGGHSDGGGSGGITTNESDYYWNNITMEEIYDLISWVHWSRDIQDVGNPLAAANGGVLMARILQGLKIINDDHQQQQQQQHHDDVTIILGHDTDLDAIATALGMTWELPPPFLPGYKPTPPGSGLHFAHDGKEVEISFVAPTYFASTSTSSSSSSSGNMGGLPINSTGILTEFPVTFDSRTIPTEIHDNRITVLPSIQILRNHIREVLGTYHSSSLDCFEAAEIRWSSTINDPFCLAQKSHLSDTPTSSPQVRVGFLVVGWLGFISMAWLSIWLHRRHQTAVQLLQVGLEQEEEEEDGGTDAAAFAAVDGGLHHPRHRKKSKNQPQYSGMSCKEDLELT